MSEPLWIEGQGASWPVEGRETSLGYYAIPKADASERAVQGRVILLHDVWGLTEHTRTYARRLAQAGFRTLAIDLYKHLKQFQIGDPGRFIRGLDDRAVLQHIEDAVRVMQGQRRRAYGRGGLAVVGFCMGGMYALLAAARVAGLDAAVCFYGLLRHDSSFLSPDGASGDPALKPFEPMGQAAHVRCPTLALYGDRDELVAQSDVATLRIELARSGCESRVDVYQGAGHAFMNDSRPQAFHEAAAREAWRATVAFLKKHTVRSVPMQRAISLS